MARPKKRVDARLVRDLAAIQCSWEEMANITGASISTLQRRFEQVVTRARDEGKSSVKRAMWKKAKGGNVAACIFWGKQYLGWSEKLDAQADQTIRWVDETAPIPKRASE